MDNNDSKPEKINFSNVHNNYMQEFVICGKSVSINAFFSVRTLEKYFDYTKSSADYREAFAKIVYFMYGTSNNSIQADTDLSEQDFFSASDDELAAVMTVILSRDNRLSSKFEEISESNQYDKFYKANKNSWDETFAPLKRVIESHKKTLASTNLTRLQNLMERNSLLFNDTRLNQLRQLNSLYTPSLNRIVEIQAASLNAFSQHLKSVDLSRNIEVPLAFSSAMQSILSAIPKIDFAEKLRPLLDYISQNREMFANATLNIQNVLASIDFSMLTYHAEWSERHDFLVSHGWFYLNKLPREIIDKIYNQKVTISTTEVDTIICEYFRENSCTALKKIVKLWASSPYFKVREHIFHQALVNHSRKYYNTSITMIALHTEGVITDFLRIKLQTPKFKAINAIVEIRETVEDIPLESMSLSDWQVYDEILDRILSSFSANFSHTNPAAASDSSRNKIAHGHVVIKETESNSLRQFLYLNEIYRLFMKLDTLLVGEDERQSVVACSRPALENVETYEWS